MAKKRFLAILLSVLMLIQAMPMNALAAGVVRSNTLSGEVYYNVDFVVGDDTVATQLVESGAELETLPEDPTLVGHEFTGWKDQNGNAVTVGTKVNSDLTVSAQFTALPKYTVTVEYVYYTEANGEEVKTYVADSVKREYTKNDAVDTIVSPTSAAMEIESGLVLVYPVDAVVTIDPATLTADQVITVEYTLPNVTYTVEHRVVGTEKVIDTETLTANNGAIILPAAKEFENYEFASTTQMVLDKDKAETLKGIVYYNPKEYKLNYNSMGGSYVDAKYADYGSEVAVYTSSTGIACGLEEHTHTRSECGSTYNPRCGKTAHTHSSSCNATVYDPAPTRTGYTFAGWYLDEACTQAAPTTMTIEGETTVYAKWEGKTVNYTVVYQKEVWNNTTGKGEYTFAESVTRQAKVGETVTATDDKNYTYYNPTPAECTSATVAADGSTVVYAKYPLQEYTFEFNLDSNSATLTINGKTYNNSDNKYSFVVRLGEDISSKWPTSEHVSRSGYTFYGWDPENSTSLYVSKRFEVAKEMIDGCGDDNKVVFVADYQSGDKCYVQYWLQNVNGSGYTVEKRYSQPIYTDGLSAKALYGFTKTSTPNGYKGNQYNQTIDNVEYDTVYNFYYNRDKFSITYMYKDATLKTTNNVYFGADISTDTYTAAPTTKPTSLDSEAYFVGWYDNVACTGDPYNFSTMPGNNLVLYAKYDLPMKKVSMDLNYDGADNSVYEPIEVKKFETISSAGATLPVPEHEGYVFLGWYTKTSDEEGNATYVKFDVAKTIEADTTVYAQWKMGDLSYTVKYLKTSDGTEAYPSKTVTSSLFQIDQTYTEKAVTVEGYRVDALEKSTEPLKITGNEIIFYYTERAGVDYTVVHQYEDGTVIETETKTADAYTERVVAYPIVVEGYYPDANAKAIEDLVSDASKNVIVFTYAPYKTAEVTVNHYYQKEAGNTEDYVLNDVETIEKVVVGDSVNANDYVKTFEETTPYDFDHFGDVKYVVVTENHCANGIVIDIYYNIAIFDVSYSFTGAVPADVTAPATKEHTVGDTVTVEAEPTAAGYTFHGWTTEDATVEDGEFTMPANDVAFVGNWTKNGVITVDLVGKTETYSGEEYALDSVEVTIDDGETETMTVDAFNTEFAQKLTVSGGKGTNVGTYAGELQNGSAIINYKGQNYDVTYVNDKLVIEQLAVTFTGETKTVSYTGAEQEITGIEDTLPEGFTYEGLTYSAKGTEADTYDGAFTGTVVIKKGDEVVTENFKITQDPGVLTISPIDTLTVSLNGRVVIYNGEAYYLDAATTNAITGETTIQYSVDNETWYDSITNEALGRTNVGETTIYVKATNPNYSNTATASAVLKVEQLAVTFTGETDSLVYNAAEQEITGIEDTLPEGFTYEGLTYSAKGTEAGTYDGAFTGTVVIKKGDEVVTENFAITQDPGTLTITKAAELTVVVTGNNDTVVYNAATQEVNGWTSNAPADVTVTLQTAGKDHAEGVNAGTYYMGLTAEHFTATSPNYETIKIEVVDGYLTITPIEELTVKVTGNTATKVYNGEAQSVEGFTTDAPATVTVELAEGKSAKATGTDVGEYPMNLKAEDFVAESINYAKITVVIAQDGQLTITPVTDEVVVTIVGNNDTQVYNGELQSVEGCEITNISNALYTKSDVALAEGVEAKAERTDVGTTNMGLTEASFVNTSKNFTKVTFVVTDGYMTITPITTEIVITAASDKKTYDGTALTNDGYTFTENVLVEGDVLTAVVEGTITDVGTAANKVTSYKVMRGETDVTGNYTFGKSVDGELEITKRPVTLTSATAEKIYDGTALTNSTVTVTGDGFAAGEGATYDVTGSQTEVGASANTFTYTLNENTKADNYTITKAEGTLTVTALTDKVIVTITENSGEFTYDGTEKTVTGYTVEISNDLYTEDDFTFSGDATVKGTNAGTYNMELKPEHFTNNSKNITNVKFVIVDGTLVIKANPVEIVITADSDEKVYDGTALTDAGYTYTGELAKGDTLTATTKGEITNVGTVANVIDTYAILDENGKDVTESYSGITTKDGTLTVTKRPVTITADSDSKEYDGTALVKNSYTNSDNLAEGQSIASVTVTGSQTMVGFSANVPSEAVIMSGETDVTANYDITYVNGTLTVTQTTTALEIESADGTWMYDGAAHTKPEYTVTFGGETIAQADGKWTLPTGDVVEITMDATATVTNVADSAAEKNTFTYTLENADQYADVTTVYGDLTITKRELTMTSASDEKEYDGEALTNDTVTVTGDGFVDGEGAAYTVTGTQTLVGSSENEFTYALNENTLAGNYDITVKFGTLTVKNRTEKYAIEVVANSGEFKYDGAAKTVEGFKTLTFEVEGNTYTVEGLSAKNTQTNAGEYVVEITGTAVVLDENGNDVTAQFAVTETDGKLIITKRELTMTSASDEKEYDGEALTNDTVTVTGDGFVDGEGAAYTVTGTQTLVGSSENEFTYALNENTLAGNYDITVKFGTLTVTDEGVDHSLVINKTHPEGEYDLHDEVVFTITVKNIYAEAKKIEIVEIEGVTITGESVFENVAPGATVTTTATWNVTEEAILAGEFVNTATAIFGDKQYEAEDTVNPVAPNGHLTSEKITTSEPANGESYALGEKISYKITVTNDGNLTVTDIEVIDALTGDKWTIDTLIPGESKEFTAEYTVTEQDILNGSVKNEVTVKGNGSDGKDPEGGDDVEDPTVDPNPSLKVEKTTTSTPANGETYALGETISYEITVTNDGNLTISNVVVTDEKTGDEWTVDAIAPGAAETFTATYVVTEEDILAGSVKNVATATGDNESDVPTKDVPGETEDETDEPNPSLKVEKTTTSTPANGETYALGETISYEITVTNDGNLTISNVVVTDEKTGDEWTVDAIAPGAAETFTATYVVTEADILAGSVKNVATATGDNESDVPTKDVPGETEDETDEPNPSLKVEKTTTSTPANGETYALGETISYEITVTNDGNLTISNVVVTDEKTGDEWKIEAIAPGAAETFTATYVVTEEDILAGSVKNVATATGDNESDVPTKDEPGNTEDETDDIDASMNVTKTSDADEMTGVGDTITYTITVTNEGNVSYTNLVVDDQLDGVEILPGEAYTIDENGDAVIAKLAVGETVVITATYVVTENDVAAETEGNPVITNKVSVEGDPIPNPKEEDDVVPGGDAEVEDEILPYTLTVNYWIAKVGGKVAAPSVVEQHFNGQTYLVVSPEIYGYRVDMTEVTGVMNGDVTIDVIYYRIRHKLTINYVYEDGTTAAPTYSRSHGIGSWYSVASPYIEGFTANIQVVSGTMPENSLEFTVTYVPDMYVVPMNIGNTTVNCGECFE